MRRAVLVLVCAAALIAAPSAAAKIVCEPECFAPYERWEIRSALPTPASVVTVVENPEPWPCGENHACSAPELSTIYLSENRLWFGQRHFVFFHELGHIFDYLYLRPGDRSRAQRIMGLTGPWEGFPEEEFANLYAYFATRTKRGASAILDLPVVRQNKLRRLIRRSFWRSYLAS